MAELQTRCFLMIATFLISFALPSLQLSSPHRFFSLQLHLQLPTPEIHLHKASVQQPLTPYVFADEHLSYLDESSQQYVQVGSVHGLYLANPAALKELRFLYCTAVLGYQAGVSGSKEAEGGGSLVLMGSLDSGAIAVVGGTGSFAFASGQAKVSSMAAARLDSEQHPEQLSIYLDVELQGDEQEELAEIASI